MLIKNFETIVLETENSKVTYLDAFLDDAESADYFQYFLNNIDWKNDEAIIYGKKIVTKRKIAWFGDSKFDYNYSGSSRLALSWNKELLKIKNILEQQTGYKYNSCLLNLYHCGQEGMAFHSDDQNHLIKDSAVAIISFGVSRYFKLRETKNRTNQYKLLLENGSLLLMTGKTQQYWQHEIPKMLAAQDIRISLTWRSMK